MFIILSILLSLNFLNVICKDLNVQNNATISFNSHSKADVYDLTTIYRITNKSLLNNYYVGFKTEGFLDMYKGSYSIELHARTNAIGMPIKISNFFQNGFIQNNSDLSNVFDSSYWENITDYSFFYNAMKYKYYERYYSSNQLEILTLNWTPTNKQTCLAITYYHTLDSDLEITLSIFNTNNSLIISTKLEKCEHLTTLKVTNMAFVPDQTYELKLNSKLGTKHNYYYIKNYGNWFGLLQITGFSNDDEEEVTIIPENEIGEHPKNVYIFGNSDFSANTPLPTKPCLNGGYVIESNSSVCLCPPGFTGNLCEIGCGSNFYGVDCKGICSMHSNMMCRGIYMCTKYGCTCPSGVTGPFCDEDCDSGKYGNDCKQTCSSNCYSNTCDQYTGICSKGCYPGYIPPFCLERYPSLINPPTQILSTYETIEIMLDFKPNNIRGGNKFTKLKYYQLLYKSLKEENFTNSELKLINQNNYMTGEVLNELESDTTYKIGVLVVSDDGNFNEQDIEYSYFRTTCMQPQVSSDYNIQFQNGIKNIYITWNQIIPKRFECKIVDYGLTLTYNHTQNKISGIQEINVSSSDSNYLIEYLYPGYLYGITLTPKTSRGPLPSSPTYSVSPLLTDDDMIIKNIVTTTDSEKIQVSWKLGNSRLHGATVDVPFTIVFRYKLNRILSCSLKELENNWTTVTIYNRTMYDIFNVIPNSQYCIQICVANHTNIIERENMVYALTKTSSPKISPVLDFEHPVYVTNNSVSVRWNIDSMNCSKINGFVTEFYVKLMDKNDNILQTKVTRKTYIFFDDLISNTSYELKVFIKTNEGYNPEHYLKVNFTTKFRNLMPVNDVVVYKKSLSKRMVGLRWNYSDDTSLDGFIVWMMKNNFANITNATVISPEKCSAWPEYYCHTFYNLSPINNHTIKIKAKSQDYPEGGEVSFIYFNYTDGLPDPPNNLKTIEIGRNYITLQWDIPRTFNGELDMFILKIEEISAVDMETCCYGFSPIELPIEEEAPTYNYTVMDLKSGSTYSVGILSVTKSSWYSFQTKIYVTMPLNL